MAKVACHPRRAAAAGPDRIAFPALWRPGTLCDSISCDSPLNRSRIFAPPVVAHEHSDMTPRTWITYAKDDLQTRSHCVGADGVACAAKQIASTIRERVIASAVSGGVRLATINGTRRRERHEPTHPTSL